MHRGPGLESAESLPASGATPGNLGNKEPTVTWPVPPWSRDTAHLGWVQLHSCLSSRGPQKKKYLSPSQLEVGGETGEAQLGMGCHEIFAGNCQVSWFCFLWG